MSGEDQHWRARLLQEGVRSKVHAAIQALHIGPAPVEKGGITPDGPTPWGFAAIPSFTELRHQQQALEARASHRSGHCGATAGSDPDAAASAFEQALERDPAFHSPFCTAAMASALGLSGHLRHLSGSLVGAVQPEAAECDAIHKRIDAAWSMEAVRRGIASAKAGDYEDAYRYYSQALHLDPRNSDALVARGAAAANQKRFPAALRDFRDALARAPDDANAAKYLQAVEQHLEQKQQQEREQRQHQEQQQQHEREHEERRVREACEQAPAAPLACGSGGANAPRADGQRGELLLQRPEELPSSSRHHQASHLANGAGGQARARRRSKSTEGRQQRRRRWRDGATSSGSSDDSSTGSGGETSSSDASQDGGSPRASHKQSLPVSARDVIQALAEVKSKRHKSKKKKKHKHIKRKKRRKR